MGSCSSGSRGGGGGGGIEKSLSQINALEKEINEIMNPNFDFEGSEKQKAWANDIVKQVYETMIPYQDRQSIKGDIAGVRYNVEYMKKYPNETDKFERLTESAAYQAAEATEKFNKVKDSVYYEKAIYDGALKQLSASEIISKRGNFKPDRPLNNGFYRNTYTSRMEQGRKAPSVENGIKHFLEAFKKAEEY